MTLLTLFFCQKLAKTVWPNFIFTKIFVKMSVRVFVD